MFFVRWLVLLLLLSPSVEARTQIAVSLQPVQFIMSELLKDQEVQLSTLVSPGASPHIYDLKPSTAASLESSELLVLVSENLDAWLAFNTNIKSIYLEDFLSSPLYLSGRTVDPHFWLSPNSMAQVLNGLVTELCRLKLNCTKIQENKNRLKQDLKLLHLELLNKFKKQKTKSIFSPHPFLSYFARDFGLQLVEPITAGPEQEVGARKLAQTIKSLRSKQVKSIFVEKQAPLKSYESLAREIGAKLVVLDPFGVSEEIKSYQDLIQWNTKKILEAIE